jgi:hypothetical protein
MSLTGKYTTIYDVIERVRRSGINDFTEEEAKEWTWEVISLMGEPKHFEDKVAVLPIEDARACLPFDLYDLTEGGVRDYYTKMSLIKESNIYYDADNVENPLGSKEMYTSEGSSVVYIDGIPQEVTDTFYQPLPGHVTYEYAQGTYKINHGFLFTGFKTGVVELAYKAFPTDNENNPMVQDSVKVIRAVVAYISKMVIKRMWLRDEISGQKMNELSKDYSFAIAAARSDEAIGSIDDMDAIRARTNRLYRDPNMQKTGFAGMSRNEQLNIKGQTPDW